MSKKSLDWYTFGELNPVNSREENTGEVVDYKRLDTFQILNKMALKANDQDVLQSVGQYKGIVLRVEARTNNVRIKVRVPELHSAYPMPESLETTADMSARQTTPERLRNNRIIDLYPTFVGSSLSKTEEPSVGSLVYVDFGNRSTMEDPIYLGIAEADVVVGGFGGSSGARSSFKNKRAGLGDGALPEQRMNEIKDILNTRPEKMKLVEITGSLIMREDMQEKILKVKDIVESLGSPFLFSSGIRLLSDPVPGQGSATSLHYLGLAIDMSARNGFWETALDPRSSKFVIEFVEGQETKEKPKFTVWLRSDKQSDSTYAGYKVENKAGDNAIQAIDRTRGQRIVSVTGNFINFTNIMLSNGFKNISARKPFSAQSVGKAAEWWHFEYHPAELIAGVTFGEMLLKIYDEEQLKGTPPQRSSAYKWKNGYFGQ